MNDLKLRLASFNSGVKNKLEYLRDQKFFKDENNIDPLVKSEVIDEFLGLPLVQTEQNILKEHKRNISSWVGLHPQTLQTPYDEVLEILKYIQREKVDRFLDIGSGYGRVGLVLSQLRPETHFVGYEIRSERHKIATDLYEKFEVQGELLNRDFLNDIDEVKTFDCILIYDFSEPYKIERVLKSLALEFSKRDLIFIARGKSIRSIIHTHYREFYALYNPVYAEHWNIYCSFKDLNES